MKRALILFACCAALLAPGSAAGAPSTVRLLACDGAWQDAPWGGLTLSQPASGYFTGVTGDRAVAVLGLDHAVWVARIHYLPGVPGTAVSDWQRIPSLTWKTPKVRAASSLESVRIVVEGVDGHSWFVDWPEGFGWRGVPDGGAYYGVSPLATGAGNVSWRKSPTSNAVQYRCS